MRRALVLGLLAALVSDRDSIILRHEIRMRIDIPWEIGSS